MFQSLVKQTLEAFLELEMEEHLGYPKYERRGAGQRQLPQWLQRQDDPWRFREVQSKRHAIATASSNPKSWQAPNLGRQLHRHDLSLYARGMSTREIEEHVKEIYGIEISPQFVSRATEQLQQQITDWQNRPLERIYPSSLSMVCGLPSAPTKAC